MSLNLCTFTAIIKGAKLWLFCKTKTKMVNRKGEVQSSDPIKTKKTQLHVADAKRGKTHASESRLVLVLIG